MANYTITITSESEYVGPPLYVIYSTYMSPSTPAGSLTVGDTLTVSYTKNAGGQSYVTLRGIDSSIWNKSADVQLNDGDSVVLTSIGAGTDQLIADFPSSNFQDSNRNVTVEAAAPTVTAPTVNDTMTAHVVATTASSSTTIDISLSASGSGGTLEYNVSTTTSLPTSGWTTGNPSVTRGTSYYLWARRSASDYDRSASTLSIPYLTPDTSITTTWPSGSLASSATTFSVGIANGGSTTVYEVRTGSYSGTVVGSRTGNGSISLTAPAAGTSTTYYLTGKVPVSSGGNNSASNIESHTVSRSSSGSSGGVGGGTADYGVQIFDSSENLTMNVGDVLGFIVGTATFSAPNNSSGIVDVTLSGVKTTDIPAALDIGSFSRHALSMNIIAANTIRVQYTLVENAGTGSTTYTVMAINLGD
jgi:hypothetical protein